MATAFSIPSARLGARFGYRLPGVVGAALFACGSIWFITQTGNTPAYVSEYLPGMLISGAGVGLLIPTLTGAGASSLAPEQFATGAAVLTMGRQIGAALGVAILVAVLGTASSTAADFHSAWLITVAGGLAAGLTLAALGPPVRRALGVPAVRGERRVNTVSQARTHTFSWEDPAATAARGLKLAGLQYMQAIADGTLPPPPIAQAFGFEVVEAEHGRAVFAVEPAEWMYNPIGMVHGGDRGDAARLVHGLRGAHDTRAGVGYSTTDLQVRYIRAMSDATGRVLAEGRSSTVEDARRRPRAVCSSSPTRSCSPMRPPAARSCAEPRRRRRLAGGSRRAAAGVDAPGSIGIERARSPRWAPAEAHPEATVPRATDSAARMTIPWQTTSAGSRALLDVAQRGVHAHLLLARRTRRRGTRRRGRRRRRRRTAPALRACTSANSGPSSRRRRSPSAARPRAARGRSAGDTASAVSRARSSGLHHSARSRRRPRARPARPPARARSRSSGTACWPWKRPSRL